jgi:hypothetical protein
LAVSVITLAPPRSTDKAYTVNVPFSVTTEILLYPDPNTPVYGGVVGTGFEIGVEVTVGLGVGEDVGVSVGLLIGSGVKVGLTLGEDSNKEIFLKFNLPEKSKIKTPIAAIIKRGIIKTIPESFLRCMVHYNNL